MSYRRFKARSATPGAIALRQRALEVVAGYPALVDVRLNTYFGTDGTVGPGELTGGDITPVDPEWVVVGHDNYVGGEPGEYPTIETSKAEQYVADQALVLAKAGYILNTTTVLSIPGTFPIQNYVLRLIISVGALPDETGIGMMIARAGHHVTFQSPSVVRDAIGGRLGTWTDMLINEPAWVQDAASAVTLDYAGRGLSVTHSVYVQHDPGIKEGWRLIFGARTFLVQGVRNMAGLGLIYRIDATESR